MTEFRWTFSLRATAGVLLRKMVMAVIWGLKDEEDNGRESRWEAERQ